MEKIKNDYELKVEIVVDYKDSGDTWLFVTCADGTELSYKVATLEDLKEKLANNVIDYIEPYVI